MLCEKVRSGVLCVLCACIYVITQDLLYYSSLHLRLA